MLNLPEPQPEKKNRKKAIKEEEIMARQKSAEEIKR